MKKIIKLKQGFAEKYGTGTLPGILFLDHENPSELKELHLVIAQSSLGWKEENKGPHLSLMAEHFPLCFLQDILRFVERGVKITVSEEARNPTEINSGDKLYYELI